MSAIYLHIPFCRQACHYCDFHFSTNLSRREAMVNAICQEIRLQKDYLSTDKVESIYFGGGTPSLLSNAEVNQLLAEIRQHFEISPNAEITLEANPDDLNKDKLESLFQAGINRLSIGVQSFQNPQLEYLNRVHNRQEALQAISDAQKVGFDNISIDLIYGIPQRNHQLWATDLQETFNLGIKHLSAYCLTIEPKTVFGHYYRKGLISQAEDEFIEQQFEMLHQAAMKNGFEAYEISNFALPNHYARHNSNYWCKGAYLGVGPSAHSYDGQNKRQHNIDNNAKYLRAVDKYEIPATQEVLSPIEQANEYLMTSLRTQWGCDFNLLKRQYDVSLWQQHTNYLQKILSLNLVTWQDPILKLTSKGRLLADEITARLFVENPEIT